MKTLIRQLFLLCLSLCGTVAIAQVPTSSLHGSGIDFRNGTLPYRKGDKWGFVDGENQWLIAPRFDSVLFAGPGYCLVKEGGAVLLLDETLDTVTDFRTFSGDIAPIRLKPSDPWPVVRYLSHEGGFEIRFLGEDVKDRHTIYGRPIYNAERFTCYPTLALLKQAGRGVSGFSSSDYASAEIHTETYAPASAVIDHVTLTWYSRDSSLIECYYSDGRILRESGPDLKWVEPAYCIKGYERSDDTQDSVEVVDLETGAHFVRYGASACFVHHLAGRTYLVFDGKDGFVLTDGNNVQLFASEESFESVSPCYLVTQKPGISRETGYTIYTMPDFTIFRDSVISVGHNGHFLELREGVFFNWYSESGVLFHSTRAAGKRNQDYGSSELVDGTGTEPGVIVYHERKWNRAFTSSGKLLFKTKLFASIESHRSGDAFEFELADLDGRNNRREKVFYLPADDTVLFYRQTDDDYIVSWSGDALISYRNGEVRFTDLFRQPLDAEVFEAVDFVGDYLECSTGDGRVYYDEHLQPVMRDTLDRLSECERAWLKQVHSAFNETIYTFREKANPELVGILSDAMGLKVSPKYTDVLLFYSAAPYFFVAFPSGKTGYVRIDGTELFED